MEILPIYPEAQAISETARQFGAWREDGILVYHTEETQTEIPPEQIFGSGLSGGAFREYLHELSQNHPGFTLILEEQYLQIPLPCPDGMVRKTSPQTPLHGCYSEEICCFYSYTPLPQPVLLLYDTPVSLLKKAELAAEYPVGHLFCSRETLKKIKAPIEEP